MIRAEELSLAGIASWFFGAVERWPETFDGRDLGQLWTWAHDHVNEQGVETESEKRRILVQTLRAGLLKREKAAVNRCTDCALHVNRLGGRAVLDDGDFENDVFARWENNRSPIGTTSAEIMIVAEGPGQFEMRTGFPLVSYQGLAGASVCARGCGNYSTCFNEESKFPQGACKPEPLPKVLAGQGVEPDAIEAGLLQIRTERANAPVFPIQTAGNRLDMVLFKAGLWREVWNARARLQGKESRPGDVYVCNVVKCRSCDSKGEDETPSRKEMEACHQWLEMQLYIIQPKVIVALGNAATSMVTEIKEPKILSIRGQLHPCPWLQIPVILEIHPSYIIRQTDAETQKTLTAQMVETFELAKRVAAGEVELPWEKQLDEGTAERAQFIRQLAAAHPAWSQGEEEHTLTATPTAFVADDPDEKQQCPPPDYEEDAGGAVASFLDEDDDEETLPVPGVAPVVAVGSDTSIIPSLAIFIPTTPTEDDNA